MTRKRIAIYGVTEESIRILPALVTNPEVEIIGIYAPDVGDAHKILAILPAPVEASALELLTHDLRIFETASNLQAVVDARIAPPLREATPHLVEGGVEIVSPMFARLLWGFGTQHVENKRDLLQTLQEVLESYDFAIDADDLFERMIQIAIGVTGADQGSLMLLDEKSGELWVRMAIGLERELWPKIRVKLGEGISGKVAAEASPFLLRGHADQMAFHVVHERTNVVSAISVPLMTKGRVIGVLNLHHSTLPDIFTHSDLHFVQQLATIDAQLIEKAQEFSRLRATSARYDVAQTVREILRAPLPMRKRLRQLCQFITDQIESAITAIYLHDRVRDAFTLVATSLAEEEIGATLGLHAGCGIDGTAAERGEPILLRWSDGSLVYAAFPITSDHIQVGLLSIQIAPGRTDSVLIEGILHEIVRAAGDEIAQLAKEEQIEVQLKQTRAISKLGIALLRTETNSELIHLATSKIPAILGADYAILRLREKSTGRLCIRSYFGPKGQQIPPPLIHIDKIASREAIRDGKLHEVRNLRHDPRYCGIDDRICALLAAPLRHEGRTVGSLGLYSCFSDEGLIPTALVLGDSELFLQVIEYLDRALKISKAEKTPDTPPTDRSLHGAGMTTPENLEQRIGEEIVRAAGRSNRVAVLHCAIENFSAMRHALNSAQLSTVVQKLGENLRAHMRVFDVLSQTSPSEFTALIPDLGEKAEQQISSLARSATHEIAELDVINTPVAIRLAFGYALYPRDGRSRTMLLERAHIPRIRVL